MNRIKSQGFTLLEMLVAMLLLGLLAGLIFGGLQVASRSWEKVSRQAEQADEAMLVQSFLRQLVERVRPVLLRDPDLVIQVAFRGQDNQLLFVAPLPHQDEKLAWFSLGLEQNAAGGSRLVLRSLPFQLQAKNQIDWDDLALQLQQQVATPGSELLGLAITSLQIDYLPREDEEGMPQWQPDWLLQEQLPELIRLRFEPEFTYGQGNTELVIAPLEGRYVVKENF